MLPLKRDLAITSHVLNVNKKYAFCDVQAANEIMYLFIRTLCLINEISYVINILIRIKSSNFQKLLKLIHCIKEVLKTYAALVETVGFNVI